MKKITVMAVILMAVASVAGAVPGQVEWVTINGGKFTRGVDQQYGPEISVKTFEMSKTAVTVAQYAQCVDAGACDKPGTGAYCNWGAAGREDHPINCVDWLQAKQYAGFMGARLPSESEWEYAARSGGKNNKYPWGDQEPASELAVMNTNGTMPVCSKPAGNTEQGLCDMAGNVSQWVQDRYQDWGANTPADGSAYEGTEHLGRVLRGGGFVTSNPRDLRTDHASVCLAVGSFPGVGFRIARSSR